MFVTGRVRKVIAVAAAGGLIALGAVGCEGENPVETDLGGGATGGAEDQNTQVDADLEEEQGETASPEGS